MEKESPKIHVSCTVTEDDDAIRAFVLERVEVGLETFQRRLQDEYFDWILNREGVIVERD